MSTTADDRQRVYDEMLSQGVAAPTPWTATIEGIAPLLMHNRAVMVHQAEAANAAGNRGKKYIPGAEEEARWGEYRLPTGELYLPALNVQRAMVEAAKQFRVKGKRTTYKTTTAAAVTAPDDAAFILRDGNGEPLTDYEIDVRRVVVMRAAVMRARPKIPAPWYAEISMGLDAGLLPPEMVLTILMTAGAQVGMGDYRPERGGPFGRFNVLSFATGEPAA